MKAEFVANARDSISALVNMGLSDFGSVAIGAFEL